MDNTKLKSRMSGKIQDLQKPVEVTAADTATADSCYLALTNNALDIIRANLKSQPLTLDLFDIVKSPSGGSTVFSVPGLAGDEPAKELTGIVLDYTTPRAYWDTPDPVEGTPPVCLSQNSIISHDGKACARCPYNDFGSKDGESNAKACKESVLLFLLRPDNIIPLLVRVPATSKARFLKYSTRLLSTLTPISSIVTKITLGKATSKGGKPYALFNFKAVSVLPTEEADGYFSAPDGRNLEYTNLLFSVCGQFGIRYYSATQKERYFVEEVTRVTWERQKEQITGIKAAIRPAFSA